MQELGMDAWELWHEDKRDSFFFFESQPGFKRFADWFAPHGPSVHARFEASVVAIMKQYEARVSTCLKVQSEDKEASEQSVYWRLLTYKSPQPLSLHERASEIMDHIGKTGSVYFTNAVSYIHTYHNPDLSPRETTTN